MVTKLSDWLQSEMNSRDWLQADLARKSGMTPAQISRIISGEQKPGLNTCIGLARALDISVDAVARRIRPGELPPLTEDSEQGAELMHQFRVLNRVGRKRVVDYARYQRSLEQGRGHLVMNEQRAEYLVGAGVLDGLDEDQQRLVLEVARALAAAGNQEEKA